METKIYNTNKVGLETVNNHLDIVHFRVFCLLILMEPNFSQTFHSDLFFPPQTVGKEPALLGPWLVHLKQVLVRVLQKVNRIRMGWRCDENISENSHYELKKQRPGRFAGSFYAAFRLPQVRRSIKG